MSLFPPPFKIDNSHSQLITACKVGNLVAVKYWVVARNTSIEYDHYDVAIRGGHLKVVRWLHEQDGGGHRFLKEHYVLARLSWNKELVEYVRDDLAGGTTIGTASEFELQCRLGSLLGVMSCPQKTCDQQALRKSATPEIFEYVFENGGRNDDWAGYATQDRMNRACKEGDLPMIKYLSSMVHHYSFDSMGWMRAVTNGNVEVIAFLLETFHDVIDFSFLASLLGGQIGLDELKAFVRLGARLNWMCWCSAMQHGRIDVIEYLLEIREETDTSTGMIISKVMECTHQGIVELICTKLGPIIDVSVYLQITIRNNTPSTARTILKLTGVRPNKTNKEAWLEILAEMMSAAKHFREPDWIAILYEYFPLLLVK